MITRRSRAFLLKLALGLSALVTIACQKVPLLAPSGSNITLTASATALPLNGTAQLVAQVIEASGNPPHGGTHVTFTTTLGTIQPSEVETDTGGRAVAVFKAGTSNGTALITAISGGASASGNNGVKILVGTAAVGRVTVSASPTLVPATGGVSAITAVVVDINGNVLPAAPVAFSTTAGSLDSAFATTDQNGVAKTNLTTATQAIVTASVGAQAPPPPSGGGGSGGGGSGGGGGGGSSGGGSGGGGSGGGPTSSGQASGSVIINVAAAPQIVITPPSTPPTANLPASYTFAVTVSATNGSAVRSLRVDWGDGSPAQDLGAVTGNAVVSHTYRAPGTYTIAATATDGSGNVITVSSAVTVNPASLPITITPPTTPPNAGLPAVFTIVIGTLPTGDVVRNVHIEWGDGSPGQDLGAISGSTSVSHTYQNPGNYPVTATLTDAVGNSSTVSTSVTVVATASPTVNITPPTIPAVVTYPFTANFTIQVTPPTGVGIVDVTINFGDGGSQDLGGITGTVSVSHAYNVSARGSNLVTVNVKDTLGRTTTGSVTIVLP